MEVTFYLRHLNIVLLRFPKPRSFQSLSVIKIYRVPTFWKIRECQGILFWLECQGIVSDFCWLSGNFAVKCHLCSCLFIEVI